MKHADRNGFSPGKMWSLWELLELKVGQLLDLHERLTIERGYFERGQHELTNAGTGHIRFEAADLSNLKNVVTEIEQIAASNGLTSTQQAAARTREFLSQAPLDNPQFSGLVMTAANCGTMFRHLTDITSRIRDDCNARIYFQIAPENARLYQPIKPHFGEEVERVFPIAIDDIAESGKCLALDQGTAAVFHLMRVVEAGLRALAADLGIPYAPSWEAYKKQLDKILDTNNYANLSADQKAKRPFYQDALGDVVAIKIAWRNPTMHIVKSYDTKQAAVVWSATESFMRHVAANLSPAPLAQISTGQVP
ncbi:hypothetical protein ACFYE9_15795 [Rhizobium leguminosarum]|uniref:Uncharacterized protein n=2 Tax=Rhizobium leguminosarum TaxID=384 RepID=A0A154IRN8_RHILE|nr:hypothetical protein [Rhizobium leguminosarum]KZB03285.1 hypothetical protein A4A59_35340 [Rhizobium leguminosarum]